jgi:TetR/AcrR family fatty acid metabolism transcriptional regulator
MKQHDLRPKIMRASLKVFTRKGYFKATVDDIAREAGIAKGTVYLYFKDKPSLYINTIDEHFNGAIRFLQEIQKESLSNTDKLKKIADDWLDYMLKYKSSFPMFTMENINLSRRMVKAIKSMIPAHLTDMVQLVAGIITDGIKKNEFRKVNAQIAALQFLNSIRTTFFASIFTHTKILKRDAVLDIFFNGLIARR